MPLQIGITGGIGAGKSLISKIFNALGIPSYDADSRAKRLMTTDGILVDAIKKEFGTLSYHPDGEGARLIERGANRASPIQQAGAGSLQPVRICKLSP